jgi:hypothetical protein
VGVKAVLRIAYSNQKLSWLLICFAQTDDSLV